MWKSVVGHDVSVKVDSQGDDWETDPDFVNDVSEKEQRWGAKSIEGSGRAEHINIHQLRSKVSEEHEVLKKEEMEGAPRASYGYGGKFGKEKDRMDKSAVGHEYVSEVRMHPSQTDAAKGFGGKFGIQKDRADKLALGFEYKGQVEKHPSQKDYAVGFGGKFGLQKDRQDQSALGWAHKEEVQPHPSQTDYSQGFGGRYGVQRDRMDQSAAGFSEMAAPTSSYQKAKAQEAAAAGTGGLRQRFEDMAKAAEEEGRKQAEVAGGRHPAQELQAAQRQPKGKTEMTEPELEPPPVPGRPAGEASLPPLPPGHQEEIRPPALPPWKLDSPETPRKTPAPPCVQETPIYLEGINDGGDYEEVLGNGGLQEPPPFVNDEDVGGDYEEMPDHRNIFSAEVDQDYEEIPSRLPGGPGGGTSSGPVYDLDEGELSATALYDYQGEGDDEISFDPGDTITAIEQVAEGWWRGRCRGKVGLFPANYVELLP